MSKIRVVAGKNGPCPREDNAQRFIGSEPVEVELSNYYIRRLADGDVVEAPAAPAAPVKGDK